MSHSKQSNPEEYIVRVYTSRILFPLWYYTHAHVVTEHNGVINRYGLNGYVSPTHPCSVGGFIFKNLLPPTEGLFMFIAKNPISGLGPRWKAKLQGEIMGDLESAAGKLYSFIESEQLLSYPYKDDYRVVGGPNSNTFIQWILDQVPESGLELPTSAHGKKFRVADE